MNDTIDSRIDTKIGCMQPYYPGLRDQFAMAALTGMLASGHKAPSLEWAGRAYGLADAMLAAR